MDKIKLLFVESDATFSYIIKNSLELTGKYEVETASNGKEGLEMFSSFGPDVVVTDVEIPVLDGMDVVKTIREKDEFIPLLLTSGQTGAQNVLNGYKLNINNFIKKPYVSEELDACIQAIRRRINRYSGIREKKDIIRLGKYIFDVNKQTLQYKDIQQKLSNREAQILERLCEHKEQLVLREHLLKEFWEANNFFTSRSLDVFLCKLRKRLSSDPAIKIETVRGKGILLSVT
ncbi:MAG: response regulator transcription factor [Dysgonamonadaceae bacterium]|jgi:DNA-binding response OmpR family regulator|nr:response regulator transcription factor [Dysgonamonadaceae bacterium]